MCEPSPCGPAAEAALHPPIGALKASPPTRLLLSRSSFFSQALVAVVNADGDFDDGDEDNGEDKEEHEEEEEADDGENGDRNSLTMTITMTTMMYKKGDLVALLVPVGAIFVGSVIDTSLTSTCR